MAGRLNRRRLATAALLAGASGSLLAACAGSGATSEASKACVYVNRSLATLARAPGAPVAVAAAIRQKALVELRQGLPLAAAAAAGSGRFAPLSTTISESSRVPEYRLVSALRQECAAVNGPQLPPPAPAP
ncbi:MAG: hypothetical protein M0Z87_01165 [Actinomycetota bacterium]|nr:hypothetical protein [Actinomycetota bacterium]